MHKKLITKKPNIDDLKIFKVGGCVRDKLLKLPINDFDYVVIGSTPAEMINLGFKPVGKDFPVFLHPVTREEYALARSEKKIGPGYHGFTFSTAPEITLIEDLKRRDITINAIAEDKNGQLIDPFGGYNDLKHKVIRHVSIAFTEDPLRVLRVARFSAKLSFKVADETLDLMHKITLNGELETISRERIWTEINKALMTKMSTNFLQILHKVGALTIVLPEFIPLVVNNSAFKMLTRAANRMHTAEYNLEQRFAIFYYFISSVFTLPETEEFIQKSMANSRSKELARLLVRYYPLLQKLNSLDTEAVYNIITYLDPTRRRERYQIFTKLIYMITTIIHDANTPIYLKTLTKIVDCFNKINYIKLKNSSPADFIEQIRILKFEIIKQHLPDLDC